MEKDAQKMSFFKRIKIAIFNLEEYGFFLGESVSKAVKYFFLIVLLMSAILAIASTYDFSKMINKAYVYIKNELPDFSYEDGKVKFNNTFEAYDDEYKFRLYVNSDDEVPKEKLQEYENKMYDDSIGLILLRDKAYCIEDGAKIELIYSDYTRDYDINISNKQDLINTINEFGINNLITGYLFSSLVVVYSTSIVSVFAHICLVAIFGYIAALISGVRFKIAPMFSLSIYSLTLSIVLNTIYNVVLVYTGFTIKYFDVMYLLIAYVYIVAAIFMIKYDLMKQNEEIQKIIEVQKQVKKEAENEEENLNDKEEKKKDKKEDDDSDPVKQEENPIEENKEPDGSEI